MTSKRRVPLPPEDAASWEEFQQRWDAEELFETAFSVSAKMFARRLLNTFIALLYGIFDLFLWFMLAHASSSTGHWVALAFAVISIFPVLGFTLMGPSRALPVSHRRGELRALREEWEKRPDRDALPATSPGGAEVWFSEDEVPGQDRAPLRLEDTTSSQEFEKRYRAEYLREIRLSTSWRIFFEISLYRFTSIACWLLDVLAWFLFFRESWPARLAFLPFAVCLVYPWYEFTFKMPKRAVRLTPRQRELRALREKRNEFPPP